MTRRNDHFRVRLLGWVFALLALMGQAAGAAALPECCQDSLQPFGEICSVDHAPGPANPASPHRHDQDCAVCPFCIGMVSQVAIQAAVPAMPAPSPGVAMRIAVAPPARAPPSRTYHPGDPRGPPVQA